ncbi:hypothetical protein L7F22_067649 [Adiantum nelumboides]|nr:hypothetical protein [Adiantum nelumboides]
MTRSGNRRRRVPYYPASSGSFQPKEQQSQGSVHLEGNGSMDCQVIGSDLHHEIEDRGSVPSDHHVDPGTCQSSGPDRKLHVEDRQINGSGGKDDAERLINGGVEQRQANSSDLRHNAGSRRFDGSERTRKDGNDQKTRAPESHHRQSQSRDRPPYHHHHYQKSQRWEGKDNSDQNKDPASNIVRDEGVKTQEYTPYMASRARDLKEEGNRRFQRKDYLGAMEQYELALKLTPPNHSDRAVFHSNRAACLMQMKPPQHDAAIRECNLALEVHPGFPRALLRRARAYEAVGKLELALQDVQLLLQGDVSHPDALDMAKRIRLSMGCQGDEAQQDLQGRPPTPASFSRSRSYAGASAGASGGLATPLSASRSLNTHSASTQQMQTPTRTSVLTSSQSSREMQSPPQLSVQPTPFSWTMEMPPFPSSNEMPTQPNELGTPPMDPSRVDSSEKIIHQDNSHSLQLDRPSADTRMRPLKLIYDHDIRLAEMPVNCKYGELRKLVKSKFPSSQAILMKYKDVEGDLVTITSTQELRLAEAAAAVDAARRNLRLSHISAEGGVPQDRRPSSAIGLPVVPSVLDQLRLHVVEVPAEQEPYDKEDAIMNAQEPASGSGVEKTETSESQADKERDFDRWLLEFAHLFRTHLGIDPSGHVDFNELGMELCAEALEEAITTEEAHRLFEQAGCKFQDMVAVGFLNWGNVYMCAARKEVPHDDEDEHQMDFCEKLRAVFDWAHAQFALAEEKFLLSLKVKPDFCDGMLGLGQKNFESAKLNWSLAVASQKDLKAWDSSKTLELFHSAADYARRAAELLAEREESQSKDVDEQGSVDAGQKIKNPKQNAALNTQVYLFWGNILYEHSQVEFRLGLHSWNELLDKAMHKFEVAGVSSSDITMAIHKHLSSSSTFVDVREESDKGLSIFSTLVNVREESAEKDAGVCDSEMVSGVCESEKALETEEIKTASQDDDNDKGKQAELPCTELDLVDIATGLAKSMLNESPSEEHRLVGGASDLEMSMRIESFIGEHLSADYVADSIQAFPHCEDSVPTDGMDVLELEKSIQVEKCNGEHVPADNIADHAESVQALPACEDGAPTDGTCEVLQVAC